MHSLEAFGFEWDDEIYYQSKCDGLYAEALDQLQKQALIYPCTCTRKEIADSNNSVGINGLIYPKTCFNHPSKTSIHAAYRVMVLDKKSLF